MNEPEQTISKIDIQFVQALTTKTLNLSDIEIYRGYRDVIFDHIFSMLESGNFKDITSIRTGGYKFWNRNPLSKSEGKRFFRAINKTSVTNLNLVDMPMTKEGLSVLADEIENNMTITHLSIGGMFAYRNFRHEFRVLSAALQKNLVIQQFRVSHDILYSGDADNDNLWNEGSRITKEVNAARRPSKEEMTLIFKEACKKDGSLAKMLKEDLPSNAETNVFKPIIDFSSNKFAMYPKW